MALLNFRKRESAADTPVNGNVEAFLKDYSIEVMPRTAEKVETFAKKTVMAGHMDTKPVGFYKRRDATHPTLLLEEGVILLLDQCTLGLCSVRLSGEKGWVKEQDLRFP